MSYRTSCEVSGPCTRAPFFSNPGKSFNAGAGAAPVGVPIGTPGNFGSAFDVKTLNNNRGVISNFR
jgi:hypothetical protein